MGEGGGPGAGEGGGGSVMYVAKIIIIIVIVVNLLGMGTGGKYGSGTRRRGEDGMGWDGGGAFSIDWQGIECDEGGTGG